MADQDLHETAVSTWSHCRTTAIRHNCSHTCSPWTYRPLRDVSTRGTGSVAAQSFHAFHCLSKGPLRPALVCDPLLRWSYRPTSTPGSIGTPGGSISPWSAPFRICLPSWGTPLAPFESRQLPGPFLRQNQYFLWTILIPIRLLDSQEWHRAGSPNWRNRFYWETWGKVPTTA